MNKFEFVSHTQYPEDDYIHEVVYLCFEGKYRIAYVRKKSNNGGLFWSPASIGIKSNGKKEYLPTFVQDSNFLEKDIKNFLDNRLWETKSSKNEIPF